MPSSRPPRIANSPAAANDNRSQSGRIIQFGVRGRPCNGPAGSHVLERVRGGRVMSYSGSGNTGASGPGGAFDARGAWRNDGGVPPHAFDPDVEPELFRGVLTRRIFAFLIDLVVLSVPVILGHAFIAVFGLLKLGLGWAL